MGTETDVTQGLLARYVWLHFSPRSHSHTRTHIPAFVFQNTSLKLNIIRIFCKWTCEDISHRFNTRDDVTYCGVHVSRPLRRLLANLLPRTLLMGTLTVSSSLSGL